MNNVDNAFQQLIDSMRDAVIIGDMDLIHQADGQLRSHIQEFVQQPDVSKVKQEMEELSEEYQQFIARVKDIQNEVSIRLREVRRGYQGSNAYREHTRPSNV